MDIPARSFDLARPGVAPPLSLCLSVLRVFCVCLFVGGFAKEKITTAQNSCLSPSLLPLSFSSCPSSSLPSYVPSSSSLPSFSFSLHFPFLFFPPLRLFLSLLFPFHSLPFPLPGWLDSRVVSVPDSGAEGPGFKSQPRRCRVTVLGKLFTPIVPLFTKQQKMVAALLRVAG